MSGEQVRIPAPPVATASGSRPAWVSRDLVARWCGWVRRDVTRHGESAPEPVAAVAPCDLSPTAKARVPKGVVGVISPWNHPHYLGVGDVLPALLAGSAVVSKADSQTALTVLRTRDLMAEAGLPDDLWQVVTGSGPVVGTAVVDAAGFVRGTNRQLALLRRPGSR